MFKRAVCLIFIIYGLHASAEQLDSYGLLLLEAEQSGVSPFELEQEAQLLAHKMCKPVYLEVEKMKFIPCDPDYKQDMGRCGSIFYKSGNRIFGKETATSLVRKFWDCIENLSIEIDYQTIVEGNADEL